MSTAIVQRRHLILVMTFLAGCIGSSMASGQSCKPDYSGQDKISKKQVDQWNQVLASSGILKAALLGDDVTVIALVGRSGDTNYVGIQIQKEEDNLARATFESRYHAAKGDQFFFGLTDGEPVSFVANEVLNQAKASMFGRLVMTVVLSADVSDSEMAALRDALTKKQIDAVRIALESGQVDISVDAKNGKKLSQKLECFYQALDSRGIDLSAAVKQKSLAVAGDASKGTEAAKGSPVGLTVDQVIKMVAAKVPDDVIITTIRASGSKFTLSPDDLIKLKSAGVSDEVIRAMPR